MGAIVIGAAATDRADTITYGYTAINVEGPADGTGTITSVEIWADADISVELSNCEVATFIDEGSNVLSTRDTETIGTVPGGSKQTFSGLDMDVTTGDYLGLYYSGGYLEVDATGGSGIWYVSGDSIPADSVTFSTLANYTLSLYGTGVTPAAGSGDSTVQELLLAGQI